MMKCKNLVWLIALLLHCAAFAHIIEIKNLRELIYYLPSHPVPTLMIFDIDNTLLQPETDLGSDQWFYHMLDRNGASYDYEAAKRVVLPLYFHINYHINLVPTEPDLAQWLNTLETQCDHVICLTARSFNLCEKTLRELNKNNLDFHIPEFENINLSLPHQSIYRHGVLFCGSNSKGDVLIEFLHAIHYKPQLIVFVDDKEKNLMSIEWAAQKLGIPAILFRYTGCDARIAAFDADATEKELVEFLKMHPYTCDDTCLEIS